MIMIVIRSPMSPFSTSGSFDLHMEDLSRMVSGAHYFLAKPRVVNAHPLCLHSLAPS